MLQCNVCNLIHLQLNQTFNSYYLEMKYNWKEYYSQWDVYNAIEKENEKLKLHIEAKDKAYTALLKEYEELKEDNKRLKSEIEEWLNTIRQKI